MSLVSRFHGEKMLDDNVFKSYYLFNVLISLVFLLEASYDGIQLE